MKILYPTLIAALFAAAPAWAQTSIEKAPDATARVPGAPPAGKNPDPGMSNLPDPGSSGTSGSSGDSPTNSGIVKVPPSTGTENVVKPPANIDPGITEPTGDIDRKNREKSENKQ